MVPESRPPIAHVMHSFNAERYWRSARQQQLAPPAQTRARAGEALLRGPQALEQNEVAPRAGQAGRGLAAQRGPRCHATTVTTAEAAICCGSHLRIVSGFNVSPRRCGHQAAASSRHRSSGVGQPTGGRAAEPAQLQRRPGAVATLGVGATAAAREGAFQGRAAARQRGPPQAGEHASPLRAVWACSVLP